MAGIKKNKKFTCVETSIDVNEVACPKPLPNRPLPIESVTIEKVLISAEEAELCDIIK